MYSLSSTSSPEKFQPIVLNKFSKELASDTFSPLLIILVFIPNLKKRDLIRFLLEFLHTNSIPLEKEVIK